MPKKKRVETMEPSPTSQPTDNTPDLQAPASESTPPKQVKFRKSFWKNPIAIIFVVAFAAIGGYLLFRSFAASSTLTKTWQTNADWNTGTLSNLAVANNQVSLVAKSTATATNTTAGTTSGANLALDKPAKTSSIESTSYPASNAFDGNTSTRWSSAYNNRHQSTNNNQWIYVDLGATYSINEVKLSWETAYGKAYQIQVSNDTSHWTTIYSTTTGTGGVNDLTGLSGSGRYVRMLGITRGTQWGYSLWEMAVYGSAPGTTSPPSSGVTYSTPGTITLDYDADAGTPSTAAVTWDSLAWQNTLPAGTAISYQARTSSDNTTWSAWTALTTNTSVAQLATSRYIQIQANLSTANVFVTPTLNSLTLTYNVVTPPPPPSVPTASLSASPISVTSGGSSTLTWSSTNATSCTASGGWSGTKAASGSASTGALTANTTYNLACTGAGGTANASTSVTVTAPPPLTSNIYWGGWNHYVDFCSPGTPSYSCDSPWVMASQTRFEQDAGKTASIIQFSSGVVSSVDTTALNNIWNHGSIPLYSLGTTGYSDANVASGAIDSQLASLAQSIHAWGHPMFLRFDWEMNGNWFDWGVGKNGNTAADYVAMWQHVHNIFVANGATNVTWVWGPNTDYNGAPATIPSVYPGDAYVDWAGFDGYSDNQTFDAFAGSTYNTIVKTAPSKPIMIAETGAFEGATAPTKVAYITDLLTQAIPVRYPQIRAVVWFNSEEGGPGCSGGPTCWWIESSPSATAAFKSGIAGSEYLPAGHQPTTSPIPAP